METVISYVLTAVVFYILGHFTWDKVIKKWFK